MDIKNNLALKKKRELLGSINKRKMSLRKYIDNLKQNECRLDITQITKCVFMGSLCLKPVPHLFDSPSLLKELDMRVGNEMDISLNHENIEEANSLSKKQCAAKETLKNMMKKQYLNPPKPKKKSLREQIDPKTVPNAINRTIKKENLSFEAREYVQENEDNLPLIADDNEEVLPVCNEISPIMIKIQNHISPPVSPEVQLPYFEVPTHEDENEVQNNILYEPVDLKFLKQNISGDTGISSDSEGDGLPPDIKAVNSIVLHYDDIENFKREPTPEIILSDSDEDAIDQLMFNIMDIKVGPNVYDKDFFDMPSEDIEEEHEQYSNALNEKDNNLQDEVEDRQTNEIKLIKRTPQCKICSQVFSNYKQLKKHKPVHNGDKPYLCLKCNENHTTLDQLIAHLRTHQGKCPYVCKKCNKGFKTMKGLDNHQPVHVLRKIDTQKKAFKCEICSKEFRKLCDLERHTRVHTGEKPSICNICNRRFQQAHNLNKHLLIHTKEKPFECDICNKKFGRNDVLNRHLLTHSVSKPNICEICAKSFIRISQLSAHKVKYHPS